MYYVGIFGTYTTWQLEASFSIVYIIIISYNMN